MSILSVLPVPAFDDNYLWLIHNGESAAIVDPGDAAPVLAALAALKLKLVAILLTHHHADHIGGVAKLLLHGRVPVFGPHSDSITGITTRVGEGDQVTITELSLTLSVLNVPGHTLDHIAYSTAQPAWLFCGDTLFAGGCGRLFEGTPTQMAQSLSKLASLPDDTNVFCAHEYTLANLRFALAAEPENPALIARIANEQAKRERGEPTLPTTIGLEKATNPFLRCQQANIVARLQASGRLEGNEPVATFAALRKWKDKF